MSAGIPTSFPRNRFLQYVERSRLWYFVFSDPVRFTINFLPFFLSGSWCFPRKLLVSAIVLSPRCVAELIFPPYVQELKAELLPIFSPTSVGYKSLCFCCSRESDLGCYCHSLLLHFLVLSLSIYASLYCHNLYDKRLTLFLLSLKSLIFFCLFLFLL